MTKPIIIGIDHAAPTSTVLDWALRRAETLEVPVTLVHVIDQYLYVYNYVYYEQAKESARALLEKHTVHAKQVAPNVPVKTELLTGEVVKTLSELSNEASLLVVGTDKTHKFLGAVFGGVGLQLAAVSSCPLAAVPVVSEIGAGVVVGTDGSGGSRDAVEFAAAEANRTDQELTVVHAYQLPEPLIIDDKVNESIAREMRHTAQTLLAETSSGLSGLYPELRVHQKLVSDQSPPKALIAAAESARMLVVGNRGRGRLKSLLLGSVTHDLLIHPPCPIVVTHQSRHMEASDQDRQE
jgi:nucleotide-binding universal stress UspA family protein